MHISIRSTYLFVYYFVMAGFIFAQPYKFERLSVDQGLAQNSVLSIYQDSRGFLWFCTMGGLTRYDGYSCRNIMASDSEGYLTDNLVHCIYETDSCFYIGTSRLTNCINKYNGQQSLLNMLGIGSIAADARGRLWFGSQALGLYMKDPRSKDIKHFKFNPKDSTSLNNNHILALFIDRHQVLWIGTRAGGLCRLNLADSLYRFSTLQHDPKNPASLSHNYVSAICADSAGRLWIATKGGGLNRLNSDGTFTHFFNTPNHPLKDISSLLFDKDKNALWIGTRRNGLFCYYLSDRQKPRLLNFQYNPDDPYSISNNSIHALYKDRSGIIWIGTYGGGVNKLIAKKRKIKTHLFQRKSKDTADLNSAWSFYEDRSGNIWVGTNTGLGRIGRDGVKRFFSLKDQIPNIASFQIRDITSDTSGKLWMAILPAGLGRFDPQNGKLKMYQPAQIPADSLFFYTIYRDNTGRIWIGTNQSGLIAFNPATEEFFYYNLSTVRPVQIPQKIWVTCVQGDPRGFLWVGTWGHGLYQIHVEKGIIRHYKHNKNRPGSLNNDVILSIAPGRDAVWCGTYGFGLDKLDRNTGQFIHYTTKNGLPDNVIYSIVKDDLGKIWLTTNKGLSCFSPEKETFVNYDARDGLLCNEFNMGAGFKTSDGRLFFGEPNGTISVLPSNIINSYPPQVVLTEFKKFGKPEPLSPFRKIEKIKISYSDYMITFGFAALHFKNSLKNRYTFTLEGFDKGWIDNSYRREATYTNLDPGEYVFRVKAANSDGVWNEKGASVQLIITPPFWRTWWFYSANLFLILALAYLLHRIHLARALQIERIKNMERERLRRQMAADFHDELGHRVTKISLLSKLLTTHLHKNEKNKIQECLNHIGKHTDSLFAEMREFVWELDPEKDTLYDLMAQLKGFSDTLFENTEIAFQIIGLDNRTEKISLPMNWRQNLLRIFKEGMHNILKHAKNCSSVLLEIQLSDHVLKLVLSDDGEGFDPAKVKNGNGLKNMKERAKTINGTLEIESRIKTGTRLIFKTKLP
ncbi:MAG TPA: hypothetical protein ENK44_15725 [Caldithrix abyssi]|uniref:Histidine kinase domain-containing protein n=1 Tax=Caldithrix abyssi TaxID=187145 RepID=A0A7V4UFI5_CALAY|nr:hypothetical protein [Caldithrix abyssi]